MLRVERILVLVLLLCIVVLVTLIVHQFNIKHAENCQFLNSMRENVTACCRYPRLVIWTWHFKQCFKECVKASDQVCCIEACCNRKLGIVSDDWNSSTDINITGLIYSFMLSVGNDSQWVPLITGSVTECNHFFTKSSKLHCGILPERMYNVITCVYKGCFVKCPTWNPHELENCHRTYHYVNKCL